MTPSVAAWRFFLGLLLGFFPGAWYGFLRPLCRRKKTLGDLLLMAGLLISWVYLAFGVCQGDIRLGNLCSLLLGAFLFDRTIGRILRPVWEVFWNVVGWFPRQIRNFFRNLALYMVFSNTVGLKPSSPSSPTAFVPTVVLTNSFGDAWKVA